MRNKFPIAAVIDIGSNELRLHIAQAIHNEGEPESLKYIENLSYPLSLGRDTFHAGKMSFEKADKACEIIRNFLQLTKDYNVTDIRTIASTAMREASNVDYILDQIKIKTGIKVDVIDEQDEKLHIYKLLAHYAEETLNKSALVVYIGTGHLGVSLFEGGKMPRTWNISAGSLRMSELFGKMQEYTRDFYRLMEEYIAGYTNKFKNELPNNIEHFVVSGREVELIDRLAISDKNPAPESKTLIFELQRTDFENLYNKIKRKTTDRIAMDYKLDAVKSEALLPASCIYQNLLNQTNAQVITASKLLPCDGVLFEMLFPKRFSEIDRRFAKDTILSAEELAKKHNTNKAHGDLVQRFSLLIFDKIKKLHGLGTKDKLLLTVAAILHDIGECVNNREHNVISYAMVRSSDIVGLTQLEQRMVALICRYHSTTTPDFSAPHYAGLDTDIKVRVSKLAAMIRIADALDRSHTQKFDAIDVKLTDKTMIITVKTSINISLEKWSFDEKGKFFEEVFGIKAELHVKKL